MNSGAVAASPTVGELKVLGIVEIGALIATLLAGLLYVRRKGALRWV
jgi:NADH:ubiquinone oxidoreductase subunit 3 (subunit A)